MEKEIIQSFFNKTTFDTCNKIQTNTDRVPGKVVLDGQYVGGSDITYDASPNGFDLDTNAGSQRATLDTGKFGTYSINSIQNQRLYDTQPAFAGAPFSAEIYVYPKQVPGANNYLFFWYDNVGGQAQLLMVHQTDGKVFFRIANSAFIQQTHTSSQALPLNQWSKIAVTVSGGGTNTIKIYLDYGGAGLNMEFSGGVFGGTFPFNEINVGGTSFNNPTRDISVDEIRLSTSERLIGELADPGASGYSVDGNTYALYHCEEVTFGGTWNYYTQGTITTPEITANSYLFPEQIQNIISDLPANTDVEMRYRTAIYDTFGSWSSWVDISEIDFNELIMYKKIQFELRLNTSDVLVTPEISSFTLFGERTDGTEPLFLELSKLKTNFGSILVTSGFDTKERLYDNRLQPFWESEEDTWIVNKYEGDQLPVNVGWIPVTAPGDGSETVVGGIFNTNTTNESWGINQTGVNLGDQVQFRFRKDAGGATERRGIEIAWAGNTRVCTLYFWNDYVSFVGGSKISGYAIDTTVWHTYQILYSGDGVGKLELRIDGDPAIRIAGNITVGGSSPGTIANGWVYPINTYASAPHENLQLDYIRGGYYEPWHEVTVTLENTNVKDLIDYAEITFDEALDAEMAYMGKLINVKEFSIQYWNGAIWKDWFVEITEDQFYKKYWYEIDTEPRNMEKVRLLIHERIDPGENTKIGEFYVGNILYQAPDTPRNLEDKDKGKNGNYELGSGKVTSWNEYESNYGRYLFNLIPDRHQEKFKEFYDQRTFYIMLEPLARIDRFFKATWINKWDAKYSTGFREVGWDINMEIKQTI